MARATKTLNPLHFEDLEPHRFEDLVRQLAYDFRSWRSLEALGRSGSDDGIDIFGQEIVGTRQEMSDSEEGAAEAEEAGPTTDVRPWVIQCKRERSIGPTKARGIVEDFFQSHGGIKPYGYILSAACDFSKNTRDKARDQLAKHDVQEIHFWGKGELEDMLLQPKNDHLLFVYFGISLQIRRRSMRTELRSRLTLKRKLVKELGRLNGFTHKAVLIRDPNDEEYPFIYEPDLFVKNPKWRYWEFHGHEPPDHVAFITKKLFAYMDWETGEWDILESWNDATPPSQPELAGLDWGAWDRDGMSEVCRAYWSLHVPPEKQAHAVRASAIPYDRILLVDELGDSSNEGPHLLVDYMNGEPPFPKCYQWMQSEQFPDKRLDEPDLAKRISIFPKEVPDEREQWRAEVAKRVEEARRRGR